MVLKPIPTKFDMLLLNLAIWISQNPNAKYRFSKVFLRTLQQNNASQLAETIGHFCSYKNKNKKKKLL